VNEVSFEAFIADFLIDERGPSQQPGRLLLHLPASPTADVQQSLKQSVRRRDDQFLKIDGAIYRGGNGPSQPTRPDDQLPSGGETGGHGELPSGIDLVMQILARCCRLNSWLHFGVIVLLVVIVTLLLRR
jgi:hypothetical protein